ncbi:zwei Ig domain protein zig-8-like [Panulirus ornatus]|uniref:zwei Ig domain protein zig-8-like n=1 Tax=Panulirus ornatus TaxID=150431 RepID=UPI003A842849
MDLTEADPRLPAVSVTLPRLGFLILVLATWTSPTHADGVAVDPYPELTTVPYFLSPGHRNITTSIGQTAYLHCRVALLGDKAQVSWIRKRDLHVLSSGMVVFASDQRFQVIHPEKSENWTLQIKYAQLRDSGVYECQVNTAPKLSMSYILNVVESRSIILGPEYVKAGSTINLTCIINQVNMPGKVSM